MSFLVRLIEDGTEGKDIEVNDGESFSSVLKKYLSGKKFKSVVAVSLFNNALLDIDRAIPNNCSSFSPIFADSKEGLDIIRHSTAHVMAQAVKRLFPDAKVTIGPAIDTGFYYDFDVERPFSSEDFEAIEKEMQKIVAEKQPFIREEMTKEQAIKRFENMGEPYKLELISLIESDTVSLYT